MKYGAVSPISEELVQERNRIEEVEHKGKFWKVCPGATGAGNVCCDYQVITPALGCGMYCSFCFLQEYLDYDHQVVYKNFEALAEEVRSGMAKKKKGVIRFGTGEYADSLFMEPEFGISQKIADLLEPYNNVLVEFKTKSNHIEELKNIKRKDKVIVAFSMNTEEMIEKVEQGTASLEERLEAAAQAIEMGFWVAFHFDPIIWYPQWKEDYPKTVDRIFEKIKDPSKIAWWSLGAFRTNPSLKSKLKDLNRHLPLFGGEMILGKDKKLRYFRSVRADFYRVMDQAIDKNYSDATVYICMETRELWKDSGMERRIPGGLTKYLDDRARQMLNYYE